MTRDERDVLLSDEDVMGDYEPVSFRIIRLISIISDKDANDLEPLGRVIDTDALDALFSATALHFGQSQLHVLFDYEGFRVEIGPDGSVRLLEEA